MQGMEISVSAIVTNKSGISHAEAVYILDNAGRTVHTTSL